MIFFATFWATLGLLLNGVLASMGALLALGVFAMFLVGIVASVVQTFLNEVAA